MKRKSCPFCGGEVINDKYGVALKYLECDTCGARTEYFRTIEEAEEAWNRRAPIDKLVEQIQNIKKVDKECHWDCENYDWDYGCCEGECDDYIKNKAIEIVKKGGQNE